MKKQYLKQLIQECVNILVTENFLTEDGGTTLAAFKTVKWNIVF
jgi:hypothetical protein